MILFLLYICFHRCLQQCFGIDCWHLGLAVFVLKMLFLRLETAAIFFLASIEMIEAVVKLSLKGRIVRTRFPVSRLSPISPDE